MSASKPNLTVPQEFDELRAEIKALKQENQEMRREIADATRQAREADRAAEKAEDREDQWLQEKAKLRARVRRRELDELEKAAHKTRLEAIRSLRSMVKSAASQARNGKPALLRMILRATR